jgi:hypothetical protein
MDDAEMCEIVGERSWAEKDAEARRHAVDVDAEDEVGGKRARTDTAADEDEMCEIVGERTREEKDAEARRHAIDVDAVEAGDGMWGRALQMLQCHTAGVPSLLGLTVVSLVQKNVTSGLTPQERGKVPACLRPYIDRLSVWAQRQIAAADDARERVEIVGERTWAERNAKASRDAIDLTEGD